MDWPDVITVKIPPQPDQDNEQNIPVSSIRRETNLSEIPQLESDIDEEEEGQFEDLQTYLTHHNTYQKSQNRASPQGRAPQALTLWSLYMIPTEQNPKKDQENSTHVTEICEYPINFFLQ